MKSGEDQEQASQDLFWWSHTEHFPSAMSCDMYEVLPTKEAYQRLNAQSFYWGLVTLVSPARYIPKFQTLRNKAGVEHKSCLYKQLRHSEPLLSVNGGSSPEKQVP